MIDFLNELSYGTKSNPEILATRQEWLDKVRKSRMQHAEAIQERQRKAEGRRRKAEQKTRRGILKKKAREAGLAGQDQEGAIHD